jgi:predicted NodU family carbamoyl transferase
MSSAFIEDSLSRAFRRWTTARGFPVDQYSWSYMGLAAYGQGNYRSLNRGSEGVTEGISEQDWAKRTSRPSGMARGGSLQFHYFGVWIAQRCIQSY